MYRLVGVDPTQEQRWTVYARSVVAFSAVSVVVLYVLQRVQGSLPLNPTDVGAVPPAVAFNTAVSFVTNTNWQSYGGESTMSHLTQAAGLAVQNFVSAGVGMAVAIALVRGLVRRRSATIGNFWVDLTRSVTRVLLPLSFVAALVFASQGVVQNLSGGTEAQTLDGGSAGDPGRPGGEPGGHQGAGDQRRRVLQRQLGAPLREPERVHEPPPDGAAPRDPVRRSPTRSGPSPGTGARAGRCSRRCSCSGPAAPPWRSASRWAATRSSTTSASPRSRPTRSRAATSRARRCGSAPPRSGIFAASTTGTSTGAVISSHDSFTPGGGAVPLVNMMLGEVSPGGVGAGLYGMLVFALLAVFIAGLMVGRTPEFLGKKIQAAEMKLVVLYILAAPAAVLVFAGASVLLGTAKSSMLNPGPHGLSEVVYAYTSAANNNGSAFGGLDAATDWYTTTLGLAMLIGRFLLIIPVLGIAGSLARKQPAPPSAGTFPTDTPLFTGLLVGVIVIVVGLTFFPALALGPLVEGLGL